MPAKIIHFLLLTAFCSCAPYLFLATNTQAETQNGPASADAHALQNKYNSLISLSFSFDQTTRTGTRERKGSGSATFYRFQLPIATTGDQNSSARKSVMRWDYTEPDFQVIISDGETLSIYTQKDKQLIRTPAKELESDITYAFFAGTRNLLDDFEVQTPDNDFIFSSAKELNTLLLVPRQPHNQIRDIQVWFDKNQLIHHLLIRDHFDSITELNFSEIVADKLPPGDRKIMNDLISFPIPPGTEIISR